MSGRIARGAEAAKLLENIFRSVNIALVNEMKMCRPHGDRRLGSDRRRRDQPFGFMRFDPGPGMGGHCIPVDPFYLTWKAREWTPPPVHRAGRRDQPPVRLLPRAGDEALNDAGGRCGATVLVLGLAYKPDVDDIRETPAPS